MRARFIHLSPQKAQEFSALKREAERDGAHRVARRLHAVLLNHQRHTSGEIARLLEAPRSKVSLWLQKFQSDGWKALLEGHRSGRPKELNSSEMAQLDDIVDSGPVAYGFASGVWTSPMIARVIADEFAVHYHPGHVRKVLKAMGFSVQRPRRQLVQGRPGRAGSLATLHLSPAKKKPLIAERPCSLPTKPVFAKIPLYTKPGRAGENNR